MALFLEVIEGPGGGQKFKLVAGVRLGRSTGEILIQDPKVSALHAQVESNENNQLFLVDRGSSNGLRINGKKVQRIALMPGVKLQIGRTLFKVVEVEIEESPFQQLQPTEDWREVLKTQIPQLNSQNQTSTAFVQAFQNPLQLEFLEGLQTSTKLVLGYGPRRAGSDVLDIELRDPAAPEVAFEIVPEQDGSARFQTAYPDIVHLNDVAISSDILKSGDQIRFGNSLIEVKFLT